MAEVSGSLKRLSAYTRWRIRRAGRRSAPLGFVSQPEPRTIGNFARGRQLLAGNLLVTGHLVELDGRSPWAVDVLSQGFSDAVNGFEWLDDLASVGDANAKALAQSWVQEWIARHRRGTGGGWDAAITGQRLIRMVNHGLFLVSNAEKEQSDAFFQSLAQQTRYLSKDWRKAPIGLPRFEALSGVIYASLAVDGMQGMVQPLMAALCRLCDTEIDDEGAIRTRNPQELLDIFSLLNWVGAALTHEDQQIPTEIQSAMTRIAPTLRTLRHANGELCRFHGGGRGDTGRLDKALADSGVRPKAPKDQAMGYARLAAGTTTVLVDGAAPPTGVIGLHAHASTAAFEMTSGAYPVIVSCGSGVSFGNAWRQAGRATPSHSTLGIDGTSSSRFGSGTKDAAQMLVDVPTDVQFSKRAAIDGTRLALSHNGYAPTHGLIHKRTIDITLDGRGIVGEDTLVPDLENAKLGHASGTAFSIRFHIHPDTKAKIDLNGNAISLSARGGDVWVFRHDGQSELSLEAGVYLEQRRAQPRAADQICLSGVYTGGTSSIRWTLAKATEGQLPPDTTPTT